MRDGEVDFVAGPAHVVLLAFPEWQGAKLLAALSQGMYWVLVMRSDLDVTPGDVEAVKGRTIGAAPLVELTLRRLLAESRIDLVRDQVKIVDVKRGHEPGVSFGVAAAKALEDGQIDGFWANAMGAQNAIRSGVGKVVLDVRRGVGPKEAFHYTFPALVTSDRVIGEDPDTVAAGVRAIVAAQRALVNDVALRPWWDAGSSLLSRPNELPMWSDAICPITSRRFPINRLPGLSASRRRLGLLRTSATTSESVRARAPCGDVTRGGGIPGVPIRQYGSA